MLHQPLTDTCRAVKRENERFFRSIYIEMTTQRIHHRILHHGLTEQTLVEVLFELSEIVAQIGRRTTFVQFAFNVLYDVEGFENRNNFKTVSRVRDPSKVLAENFAD